MDSYITIGQLYISIKKFYSYYIKKWKSIFIVSFTGAIFGICYAYLQDPKYTAELTFVSEGEKTGGLGGYASIAAQFGLDIGGGNAGSIFGGDNLVELLKSRNLVDKTLLSPFDNGLFIDQYVINHKLQKGWKKDTALQQISFQSISKGEYSRERDSIFNKIADGIIKNKLTVEKIDKKLDIITIKMQDIDMYFAKRFSEKLSENAIKFYTQYKNQKNLSNLQILQKQTDSVKSLLFGGISEIASLNDVTVNPIKQAIRTNGQKKQIDLQVNSVLYTELLKNLEIARLTLRKETPLVQIIDTPKLPLKNEKKGRLFMGFVFAMIAFILSTFYMVLRYLIRDIITEN